ncbi:MAG: CoB--CoM heterodisulfide reductase iron-sulfur subunit A family protein [Candidatus Eremiobacteraeota bacterium]|nr:CoB--CoM heterodisulfide reductase iron-sulfur subunit A family protein [Candidatus Eremiobacteraeota bacterium]
MQKEITAGNAVKADVLVLGAGIAGLQASLDLADEGYDVILVEKGPSIGGRMINLSKVFPTLDCASCITTPRMASVAHHPRILTLTFTEMRGLEKKAGGFTVKLEKKPRYVREALCIGCKRCEEECPVYAPDEYEHSLGARKAISIPFTNAIPQYPVLDRKNCILCGSCARICPTAAVDYLQEPEALEVEAGAVLIATGWNLTPLDAKDQYGKGKFPNVISPMQAERLLAPHGPYGGVMRPSDGRTPSSIAYVQCAGSRDRSLGVPYCSRVCCMYAIKQAMLLSGSLPVADITIYYMDIRAFGKGYEQFYQNAKAMGINFVKAKVGRITGTDDDDLLLRIERQEDQSLPEEARHDLVVLSLGLVPSWDKEMSAVIPVEVAPDGFIHSPHPVEGPARTTVEGIFAAGTALGPKDIVDSIVEASAAAMEITTFLKKIRGEKQDGSK